MFSLSFISAEQIGERQPAEINKAYTISQPCASCTYINISVFTKDGVILNNVPMTDNGSTWTYTFTPTSSLRHDVNGIGDINGIDDSFAFYFEVTDNGKAQPDGTVVIVFLIAFIIIVLFGIYSVLKMLGVAVQLEADIVDVALNIGAYLAVFALYVLSTQYLGNLLIEDILLTIIKFAWITHVLLPLIALAVSMIMNPIKIAR